MAGKILSARGLHIKLLKTKQLYRILPLVFSPLSLSRSSADKAVEDKVRRHNEKREAVDCVCFSWLLLLTSYMTSYMIRPMNSWQLQKAKARFSEFLDAALKKGPQIVTRRGVEAAVLVPMAEWRRLQRECKPNIKELLLGEGPRFEEIVPKRGEWKSRPAIDFSGPDFK
jgi:antitoxin Phd